MTPKDLIQIKESISRIEKFPVGYPKRITCTDPRWQKFFDWEYELCKTVDKSEEQMKLVV